MASMAFRPAVRLPVYLLASVVFLAFLAANPVSHVLAQPSEPADPLALYDANDDGAIDADEVIQAMTDYRYGRIDGALAYRVWRLYEPPADDVTTRDWTSICSRYDRNGNGVIEQDEVFDAIDDYFDGAINKVEVFAVINCYYSATHSIEIVGLPGSLQSGGSVEFTVEASNLVDSGDDSFTIRVTTNNSNIGFNGNCSDTSEEVSFETDSDNADHSSRFTLHACSAPGGEVNAKLSLSGDVGDLVEDSQDVAVTAPPPAPTPPPDTRPTFGSATVNDQTYDTGSPVSMTLPKASGGDGRLTYSVSGLPPGLSFSGTDRRISGTATSTGSYQVTYSVEDADGDTANLGFTISVISPTPGKVTGLTAMPGSAHGEIALNWDPVDEADGYQVGRWIEQPGDLGVGVRFDWVVLQGSEVTIDQSNTSADVHGLTTGESYEHGVRAFQVVVSKTFEGPWSDRKMATPLDETPAAPLRLQAKNMIGDRGVLLSWRAATGAHEYVVEISGAGEIRTKTTADVKYPFDGLVPEEIYSFRVRSNRTHPSGDLLSVWSGVVGHRAPTPKHWWGHQADHIVRPVIGTLLGSRVIGDAIGRAITDWNDKLRTLNNDLEFCVTCTDDATVTVKAVNNKNDSTDDPTNDPNEGCGPARGCVKPRTESASSGPGKHMKNMYVVIEEPPRSAIEVTMPSGTPTWQHWIWEWTADQNLAGRHVQGTMNPKVYYAYIDRVMLHEFGHTLGLDDFYLDNTMDHLDALMNESSTIEDEDLKQLRAIYSRHSPH